MSLFYNKLSIIKNIGVILLLLNFVSCQKPDEFEPKTQNRIINITVSYSIDASNSFRPLILNHENGEIQFRVPRLENGSLSSMKVFINIPQGAVITPAFTGITNLSVPYRFKVTAENGDEKNYILVVFN